jgi:acyl-CoA synthetase (AMP-forming)/AMP-acid ligase II
MLCAASDMRQAKASTADRELPGVTLSLPEAFVRRAAERPSEAALCFVRFVRREPIAEPYSCGQLLRMATGAAALLTRSGVRNGERVALSLAHPAEVASFLIGTQCLGAIPIPVPGAADLPPRAYAARLGAVLADARPRVLVVDDTRAMAALSGIPRTTSIIEIRNHAWQDGSKACADFEPARGLEETAFLQYTSGSTASPKGVVVLHGNLVANLRAMIESAEIGSDDVVFSWLPLFHDMGLVLGLLLGIYLGIPTHVAKPSSFVARPDGWLRAMTKFRATLSAGPNFAYDFLARKIPDRTLDGIDLSSWRLAFNGSEPIDPETTRAFIERYAAYGVRAESFQPGYGLAECTLAAAFAVPNAPPRFDTVDRILLGKQGIAAPAPAGAAHSVEFTSVGAAIAGHTVRIVEPGTSRALPERHLGEIVVTGPSVTPGYFHELSSGALPRTELRTGDLGYIADAELYIVDRIKDLLIIAGKKYVPSDIEAAVGALPGIRRGAVAAFSTPGPHGTHELCIAAGLELHGSERQAMIHDEIRRVLNEDFGLASASILFVRPGQLPRTTSGKLRRAACRELLAAISSLEQEDR